LVIHLERQEDGPNAITIARCRELLGDDAVTLSDHEIARIRGHAETMAHLVIEIFAAHRRNPAYPAVSTARVLREATVGSIAAAHGRRSDPRAGEHEGADR
jgi:hypothetical protein